MQLSIKDLKVLQKQIDTDDTFQAFFIDDDDPSREHLILNIKISKDEKWVDLKCHSFLRGSSVLDDGTVNNLCHSDFHFKKVIPITTMEFFNS